MIEELSLAVPVVRSSPPETRLAATVQIDLAGLVATYSTLLFRVAHSILRNPAEAEDVVQDTFLRVLQHQHTLPAIRDLRVWLVRIAWNLALDRRRRIRPDQIDDLFAQSLVAAHLPADVALHESQRMQTLLRELHRLPSAERQALLLSGLEELSPTEVAAIMNKSASAVRALLFRARTHLRQRIETLEARHRKGGAA